MITTSYDMKAVERVAAGGARRPVWPLVGVGAGIAGFVATILGDIHVEPKDGSAETADFVVTRISQSAAHLSLVAGWLSVTLLLILAAMWRRTVEPRMPGSIAAGVVSHGFTAAAGALILGYGWKGAAAIYHADGMDAGTFDQTGLYVYYMLNDFGSYIGWLGVTVAAGAVAWMGLRERSLPLWIGAFSCLPVLAVLGVSGITGLPGFPGVVSPIWMVVAFAGLAFSRIGHDQAGMPDRASVAGRTLD